MRLRGTVFDERSQGVGVSVQLIEYIFPAASSPKAQSGIGVPLEGEVPRTTHLSVGVICGCNTWHGDGDVPRRCVVAVVVSAVVSSRWPHDLLRAM